MKEAKILPEYEKLYYDIAYDIGMCNDWLADNIVRIQVRKKLIMEEKNEGTSISALDRKFELTEAYREQKTHKYWTEGLAKMMAGVRVQIESLKAESKGQH